MSTVLEKIVADKYIEVCLLKQDYPLMNFQRDIKLSDRNFYDALTLDKPAYILECKPKSPSKGIINPNFDLSSIVRSYSPFASAISVLTDHKYFGGCYENFRIASQLTDKPLLCKDFIIDVYQIYYARLHGAHAVLLMLSVLTDEKYLTLREVAHSLNMGVLTETSNASEVERAIALNAKVIGINNRDLHTLTVNLETTEKLAVKIPKDRIVISESGITSHADVVKLSPYAHGFLVGSHLMASDNLDMALRALIFGTHKVCGLTDIESAKAAFDSGAYYGGLIFAETSPRYITVEAAKSLMSVPLNYVGVFKNSDISTLISMAETLKLHAVQLHGKESLSYIVELRAKLNPQIKIFKAIDGSQLGHHQHYLLHEAIDQIVLDHGEGGTGQSFDWAMIPESPKYRYLLAGGIGEANIHNALSQNVNGVDMNSQLEQSVGKKCPNKIQKIFQTIRAY